MMSWDQNILGCDPLILITVVNKKVLQTVVIITLRLNGTGIFWRTTQII